MSASLLSRIATDEEQARAINVATAYCSARHVRSRSVVRNKRDPEWGGPLQSVLMVYLADAPQGDWYDFIVELAAALQDAGLSGSDGPIFPDLIPEW